MKSRKPSVMLFSALVSALAFAAAPSLLARGGAMGGRGEGGTGTEPDDGSQPPPEDQPGGLGGTTSGSKKPGGIDFGADGTEQADLAREVFARMASNDFSRFRDDRNRHTADPASSGR